MRIKYPKPNQIPHRTYLSECIPPDEIEAWHPGDIIMIVANTGHGKSHFVKNTLREYLQLRELKCLYLLSRVRMKEQFEAELPDDDAIVFMTYQTVETLSTKGIMKQYDFIIADECHYFLDDSSFNNRTDISLDWILNQKSATRIIMTATGDGIEEYLNEQRIMFTQYRLIGNFNQIRKLNFFGTKINSLSWRNKSFRPVTKAFSSYRARQKPIVSIKSLRTMLCFFVARITKIMPNTWMIQP